MATATDPRIADLTQAGKIRVALYPPQYAKEQRGDLRGWTIELGRALAERIEVEFVPIEYPTAPEGDGSSQGRCLRCGLRSHGGISEFGNRFFTRSSSI